MDVVSLAAAGFENVVTPLGTALTPDQATLLRRSTSRVYLLFDSDPAGLKATFRAGDMLLASGVHPSVVTLPVGEDPDTLVRKVGATGSSNTWTRPSTCSIESCRSSRTEITSQASRDSGLLWIASCRPYVRSKIRPFATSMFRGCPIARGFAVTPSKGS